MRAVDVVRRVAPKARSEYFQAFEQGDELLHKAGINTPLRLAHFLAQIMHESGGLTITRENMHYRAPRIMEIFGVGRHSAAVTESEAQHLAGKPSALAERVYGVGNPRKALEFNNVNPGDGFKYRGGGIMQTTGKSNYRRMGLMVGVDFVNNPELVYSAEHALKPAIAEWTAGGLNALADKNDLRTITRRINGGYNGLADREQWFKRIRPIIDKVDAPKAGKSNAGKIAGGVIVAGGAAAGASGDWSVALFVIGAAIVTAAIAYIIYRKRK
jgi:putative chitinase